MTNLSIQNSNFVKIFEMYQASFESILKTVLVILLIYFAFKMIIKWFGPIILRYFLKKMGNKFQQQFQQQNPFGNPKPRAEKKEVIDKKPPNERPSNKKVGEYIDYEEID